MEDKLRSDSKTEHTTFLDGRLTKATSWLSSTAGMKCAWFEKQWIECASRLGRDKGLVDCANEMRDLNECKYNTLTHKRYNRMQEERIKKGLPYQDPPPYGTMAQDKFKQFIID